MIAFKHFTSHQKKHLSSRGNLNTLHFGNAYILFDTRMLPCKVAQTNDLLLNAEKHFWILLNFKFGYIILKNAKREKTSFL